MRHPLKPIAEMTDAEWEHAFPDEETCIEWLVDSRWPQDVCCPRCGSDIVFSTSLQEYRWRCFGCAPDLGYPFDSRSDTIFQNSSFPLRVWLKAPHHELTSRGISYNAAEQNMRRHIRDAVRASDFRRMVCEPSPVRAPKGESPAAQEISASEQQTCPQPATLLAPLR